MINLPEEVTVMCDMCATTIEMPVIEYANQTFGVSEDNLDGHGWHVANDSADGEHFCAECALTLNLLDCDEVQQRYDNNQITATMIDDAEHYHYCGGDIYSEPMTECDDCGEVFPVAQEYCDCQNEEPDEG